MRRVEGKGQEKGSKKRCEYLTTVSSVERAGPLAGETPLVLTPEAAGSPGPAPSRRPQEGKRLALAAGELLQAAGSRLRDQVEGGGREKLGEKKHIEHEHNRTVTGKV